VLQPVEIHIDPEHIKAMNIELDEAALMDLPGGDDEDF
jgi:hypothetical protein